MQIDIKILQSYITWWLHSWRDFIQQVDLANVMEWTSSSLDDIAYQTLSIYIYIYICVYLPWNLFSLNFNVDWCFATIYVCAPYVCVISPWNGIMVVSLHVVLGTKSRSSRRVACAHYHWALSPASYPLLWEKYLTINSLLVWSLLSRPATSFIPEIPVFISSIEKFGNHSYLQSYKMVYWLVKPHSSLRFQCSLIVLR